MWARGLLGELGWPQLGPTRLWIDNSGALNIAKAAESLGRSRHIARRANFLQMASGLGAVRCVWCSTDDLIADLLTKPLDRRRFQKLRSMMMGSPASAQDGGGTETGAGAGDSTSKKIESVPASLALGE